MKIVTIPDFETLRAIVQEKRESRNLSMFKSAYSFNAIQNALFSAYSLLLTCKKYYTINREYLKDCAVNNLYQFFSPGFALFFFPKNMQLRMKNKHYPDISRNLIKAIYSDNLVNKPDIIKKYMGDMNGNTIITYTFFPMIKICTVLERVIECIKSFMKNYNNYALLNGIAVLDYLCLLKRTHLSAYGVNSGDKNLAQCIFYTFHQTHYEAVFSKCFSQEAQNKISQNCVLKEDAYPESILLENKPIIEDLIATYVLLLPRQETIRRIVNTNNL